MARSAPAEQLLEEIFVSTGYLAALGVLENGAHRREDARRFAGFLCTATGANGISALVRAIDAAAQAGCYRAGHCARRCAAWLCDHYDHPPLQGICSSRWCSWATRPGTFNLSDTSPAGAAAPGHTARACACARNRARALYKTAAYAALASCPCAGNCAASRCAFYMWRSPVHRISSSSPCR